MNRYLGYGSLALLIGWLVLSYGAWLPTSVRIVAPLGQAGPWFQGVVAVILLAFAAIQLWLLGATLRMLQRRRDDAVPMDGRFALSVFGELFWTALPLLLTIGIAVAGYKLWANI